MLFNKPFNIKYKKNKQNYSWQDQPTNTTDHKSKPMEEHFKCNWMVQKFWKQRTVTLYVI